MKKEMLISDLVANIMCALDIPITGDLKKTPERVAKMFSEIFSSVGKSPDDIKISLFDFDGIDTISVKDIPFTSTCEHHLMPFFGTVSVEYIPDGRIIGLSKIPRIIKFFCCKPQLQERLTKEIGEYLFKVLEPRYLKIEIKDTTHTCMLCRGIRSTGKTDTTFVKVKPNILLSSSYPNSPIHLSVGSTGVVGGTVCTKD